MNAEATTKWLRRLVKPCVHMLRSIGARTLHPWRRRRAERIVAQRKATGSVLFICTGNICRSPYAEKSFRRLFGKRTRPPTQIASAGLLGPDRPSPEPAIRIAAERGISLDLHRSKVVNHDMLSEASLIVAMESQHVRDITKVLDNRSGPMLLLGDLDPRLPNRREIRDPWGHEDDVFRESFERIDRCVRRMGVLMFDSPAD